MGFHGHQDLKNAGWAGQERESAVPRAAGDKGDPNGFIEAPWPHLH